MPGFKNNLSVISIALSIIVVGMFVCCNKYDDSQIKQEIKELQEQVASNDSLVRFISYD